MAEIVKEAGVSNSTFQNIFRSKDGVLMDLTEFMFSNQFGLARKIIQNYEQFGPAFVYALETSMQLTMAELNENIREVYIEAYTFEDTLEYIHDKTSTENYKIFKNYMPKLSESDFYELEIGTGGIMRSYMAKPCNKYFTLEKKLERFLNMTLGVYNVPEEERKAIIEYISAMDIRKVANMVIQELFKALAMKFEFELGKES